MPAKRHASPGRPQPESSRGSWGTVEDLRDAEPRDDEELGAGAEGADAQDDAHQHGAPRHRDEGQGALEKPRLHGSQAPPPPPILSSNDEMRLLSLVTRAGRPLACRLGSC